MLLICALVLNTWLPVQWEYSAQGVNDHPLFLCLQGDMKQKGPKPSKTSEMSKTLELKSKNGK